MNKIILFFVAVVFTSLTFAQNKKANIIEEKKDSENYEKSENIKLINLVQNLANYAYANNDPLSILNATKILIKLNVSEIAPDKVEEYKKINEKTQQSKIANILDPLSLINEARKMTKDEHLLALANNIEKDYFDRKKSGRGTPEGPKSDYKTVAGLDSLNYWITFEGESLAEIAVIGNSKTNLNVYIYDEENNLITKDDKIGDNCYVKWRPRWTGSFKIRVENKGKLLNKFLIAIN